MKLVIPREVQIGAIKYGICRNDRLLERLDLSGHINSRDQLVRIAHRKPDQEFLILIHEVVHGICNELGITTKDTDDAAEDEGFIKALSTGVAVFLQSLGIEPDFSLIQEEED